MAESKCPWARSARFVSDMEAFLRGMREHKTKAEHAKAWREAQHTEHTALPPVGPCQVCAAPANLRRCAQCRRVAYCGSEHQKQDWPAHKVVCAAFDRTIRVYQRTACGGLTWIVGAAFELPGDAERVARTLVAHAKKVGVLAPDAEAAVHIREIPRSPTEPDKFQSRAGERLEDLITRYLSGCVVVGRPRSPAQLNAAYSLNLESGTLAYVHDIHGPAGENVSTWDPRAYKLLG